MNRLLSTIILVVTSAIVLWILSGAELTPPMLSDAMGPDEHDAHNASLLLGKILAVAGLAWMLRIYAGLIGARATR